MTVELAQVAAGLPVAASFALAGGITSLREGRRRSALNEAMHELRRPLQVLSLALPGASPRSAQAESSLQLATVALERLDREINGSAPAKVTAEISVNGLIAEAALRWQSVATDSGRSLKKEWNGPEAYVEGDRFELSQALDNLLSNAIEHGGGEVRVGWRREGAQACISISDLGVRTAAKSGRRRKARGRRRRGHGLRVVGRVAERHGGSFSLRPVGEGVRASLWLPLCRQVGAG